MKRRRQLTPLYIALGCFGLISLLLIGWFYFKEFRFKNYSNLEQGFSLRYPADWTIEENKNGAAVIFYAPSKNALDIFQENVNVVVREQGNDPTGLEEYSRLAVEQLRTVFHDNVVMLENENTRLAGLPGHKIVFVGKGVETDLKYYCVWTIKGSRAFQITYTSLEADYDDYVAKVNRLIGSFRIIKNL